MLANWITLSRFPLLLINRLLLWLGFADLRLIPLAIPLIIIARATLTDAFRSIGIRRAMAPFAQHHTRLGRFLVGSAYARLAPTMMAGLRVTAREI